MHPIIAGLAGGVVVSCQPVPDGPLDGVSNVVAMALAARDGGARGLRIEGAANVAGVCAVVDLPVIGLVKRDFDAYPVRITALLEDVAALADAGAAIIAVDATRRARPVPVAALIAAVHAQGRLAMADCADMEDAREAVAAGADIVGTTMSGYTGGAVPKGPDLAFVTAATGLGRPVLAEGRFNTPELAAAAIRAGALTVCAGTAITRPENVTAWYAKAIAEAARPAPVVLALDIGGTRLRAALVQGRQILERRLLVTSHGGEPEAWLDSIAAATKGWAFQGVAASLSGVVREGAWSAVNPATLPVPDRFPIVAALQARFGEVALAVNDAQAAAWGEFRHGAGQGRDMGFVTISSGIGAGLVMGGRLVRGAHGLAGHLGQIPFPGARLEDTASGFGIARAAGAAGAEAVAPDSAAMGAAVEQLARGLVTLQAIADPEVIVVGGGVGLAAGMLERIRGAIAAHPAALRPVLVPAALGADAGLIGAAALLAESA